MKYWKEVREDIISSFKVAFALCIMVLFLLSLRHIFEIGNIIFSPPRIIFFLLLATFIVLSATFIIGTILAIISICHFYCILPELKKSSAFTRLEDVIGHFEVARADGVETLEVSGDHTFLHAFNSVEGKGFRHEGTWEWYSSEYSSRIRFHDFVFAPSNAGETELAKTHKEWAPEVFRTDDGIIIGVDRAPYYVTFRKS